VTRRSFRRLARSRIGLRLLAFNVLVVFVPVLGILYLGVYETHLRQAQETGMAQQARILAAAIGDAPAGNALDPSRLARILDALERRTETRLQVYDRQGKLVADSARVGRPAQREDGLQRASGKAIYTADLELPGMLHTAVLRSPFAHARVKSFDASRALEAPGVRAVLEPVRVARPKRGAHAG